MGYGWCVVVIDFVCVFMLEFDMNLGCYFDYFICGLFGFFIIGGSYEMSVGNGCRWMYRM